MGKFLERKNIKISAKTYFVDAMGGMAQGLFASLLIGTILSTLAKYLGMIPLGFFEYISKYIADLGALASSVAGAAIAVGIAHSLKAPMLVMACSVAIGQFAYSHPTTPYTAGPLGVFVATIVAVELGKAVSKETKVDIILTPLVTLSSGFIISLLLCPLIAVAMNSLGIFINTTTQLHPFVMGIIVSVTVGMILTLPISSAAICASIGITGLAGGAALAGCCAHMIGFAFASFKENRWSGVISQGIGTSMLQMPNIVKHPQIVLPVVIASAITGPVSTLLFKLECSGVSAGMGTCGFVGPIGAISDMTANNTLNAFTITGLVCVCLVMPALISVLLSALFRKTGLIKDGYMKL